MNTRGKMTIVILVIGFLALIAPDFAMAQIQVNVHCGNGEKVQAALDSLTGPANIAVTGTCTEYITIRKDDVTIQGGTYLSPNTNPNGVIFFVNSARRVSILDVTVTGGLHGIAVVQGGWLAVNNSSISGATSHGVVSFFESALNLNSSTIQNNSRQGVCVSDNSALSLTNCTITGNHTGGVVADRASSARIGINALSVPGSNTITNNYGVGVTVARSAHAVITRNTITGNSSHGVSIEGASATVTNNTISNNQLKGIVVTSSGNARIGLADEGQAGPNIIEDNGYEGIEISNSAAAFVLANAIRFNGSSNYRAGISISRASGRLMGDNLIQENAGHGVAVNLGDLFQGVGDFFNLNPGPDIITQNGYSGIQGWNGARLDIRHVTVTDNTQHGIFLNLKSTLRIYDSTVSENHWNGIYVYRGSAVIFDHPSNIPPATVTNNTQWGVLCEDGESSYSGDTSGITQNGPKGKDNVKCTGFEVD